MGAKAKGSAAVYVAFLALVAAFGLIRPAHNWDVLGYVGAALSVGEDDPLALHTRTYEEVRAGVPTAAYDQLVDPDVPYRRDMAADPALFVGELPLYRARPLYVFPVYLLYHAGMNAARATVVVSAGSVCLVGLLLLAWLGRHVAGAHAALLGGLLVLGTGAIGLAGMSTPDALSMLFVAGAGYLAFEREQMSSAAVAAIGSILVRADNLPFALALVVYFAVRGTASERPGAGKTAGLLALALFAYLALQRISGHVGWAALFYRDLVESGGWAASANHPALSAADYLLALARGTATALQNPSLGLFGALAVLALVASRPPGTAHRLCRHAILVVAVAALLRFLIFPVAWNRILAGAYAVIGVAACAILSGRARSKRARD